MGNGLWTLKCGGWVGGWGCVYLNCVEEWLRVDSTLGKSGVIGTPGGTGGGGRGKKGWQKGLAKFVLPVSNRCRLFQRSVIGSRVLRDIGEPRGPTSFGSIVGRAFTSLHAQVQRRWS